MSGASGYCCSHQHSNGDQNPHCEGPLVCGLFYLRLRRSQISAAIDPTTPIAAMPEKASISGTGVAQKRKRLPL